MPITITDLDGGVGIHLKATGVVTGEDYVRAHMRHLYQNEEILKKIKYAISDWVGVTRLGIVDEDIKIVARFCLDISKDIKESIVAIVVKGDDQQRLAELFKKLMNASNWEIRIFVSTDTAGAWVKEQMKEKFAIDNLELA